MEYSDTNFTDLEFEVNLLKECKTLKDVVEYTISKFPKWFVNTTERYCEDYPCFTETWMSTCSKNSTTPKAIMFVDNCQLDSDHHLIWSIAEIFTCAGFSVKRANEFVMCEICEKAIPRKELYQMLVDKGDKVPEKWSNTCSGCNKKL